MCPNEMVPLQIDLAIGLRLPTAVDGQPCRLFATGRRGVALAAGRSGSGGRGPKDGVPRSSPWSVLPAKPAKPAKPGAVAADDGEDDEDQEPWLVVGLVADGGSGAEVDGVRRAG